MKKFKILIPVYNDWPSVFQLLKNIDNEVEKLNSEFSILIVNDGSTEKMIKGEKVYKNIKLVEIE